MKRLITLFLLVSIKFIAFGQLPECDKVYIHSTSNVIYTYDPVTNVATLNSIPMPSGAIGLAVNENFYSATPALTFYTTVGGTYRYYDGSAWINTGHTTGTSAVNPGGAGPFIYNVAGASGTVFRYDGTGNSTVFLNVAINGPWDCMGDADGNLYIMTGNQLRMYDTNAQLVCTYDLVGLPNTGSGGGYAIVDDVVYANNGNDNYVGTISGTTINFTVINFNGVSNTQIGDFANCVFPPLNANIDEPAMLTCNNNTVQLSASTTIIDPIYSWSGPGIVSGGNTATPIVNQPGVYTLTITSGGVGVCSDQATQQVTVVGSGGPTYTVATTDPSCGNNDGQIIITPDSGVTIIDYSIDNGVTTQNNGTFSNLAGGIYDVVVIDDTGCSDTSQITINATNGILINTTITNTDCIQDNGEILLSVTGGTGNYTYSWNPNVSSSNHLTGLGVGTYEVTVSDDGGCSENLTILIAEKSGPILNLVSSQDASCNGGSNGSINVIATGGIPSYTYSWTGNVSNTNIAGNLSAGSYTVTVTDVSGCSDNLQVTIDEPTAIIVNEIITPADCGQSNGEILLNATGGAGSYYYEWNPNVSTTNQATGLAIGTYEITVNDGNGCETIVNATVTQTNGPTLTITSSQNITCNGNSDGSIEVAATGGTLSYIYTWLPNVSTTNSAGNLSTGNYSVTVTDDDGCSDNIQVTITEPNAITIDETITNSDCGQDNGEISLSVTGGTGSYLYTWNPNVSSSNQATNLSMGTYEITVSDDNGCSATVSYNVLQSGSFYIEAIPENSTIDQGGSVNFHLFIDPNITVDNIVWTPSKGLSCTDCIDPIASPEVTTTYIVTVTDDNGCTATDTVIVNVVLPCADIFVPNSFSPNGDGLNDLQCVHGDCIIALDFIIFNRWGEAVFQTGDQKVCWDGTFRGKLVQSGVYAYKLRATLKSGEEIEKTGNISVVR